MFIFSRKEENPILESMGNTSHSYSPLKFCCCPEGGCFLVGRLWLAHGSVLRVQIVVLSSKCCNPASNVFLCNPNHLPSPPFDCKPKHECNMLPGFILAAPSLLPLSLSFFLLASSFFVSSLIETYGNISLCVCGCGWQLCTEALLINKQVLFDFITLSRAFLGSCAFTMNIYASGNGNVAHKLQEASS